MNGMNRRQWLLRGCAGLAAGGVATLTLRADARPTAATPDVHDYQAFLDRNGIPQVSPAGKWEPSYRDILGPFYVEGAPFRGKVTPPLEPGELLVVRGRVWSYATKKPIAHAVVDVWQADARGRYDMDDPRDPPDTSEFRNRIRLMTDETGWYEYETIRPAAYQIGRGVYRPAHIHYLIQAEGHRKLITQLYFRGDPHLKRDRSARNSNLVIQPETVKNARGAYEQGTFDIVLEKA